MSESNVALETRGSALRVAPIKEAVIRLAGNSQDGIQAVGGFLARLAGRTEQEVMTFMTIPSTISGGPSIFQVRISSGEVLSAGDEADVLVAFYPHSYQEHIHSLKKGGIVLYDSDQVQPNPEWTALYRHVGAPITTRTIEAIGGTGRDKGKNIFVLGLIARMFDLDVPKLTTVLTDRFSGKESSVLQNALAAFHAGYGYVFGDLPELYQFEKSPKKAREQVVMNGNEAIAYGLLAAGIRFGAAYPITPWSDIMEILRRELPKYGGTFVQCEDEISAICMALGGGFAGRVAVTGTSGPGLSLKMEAMGWGVMAEIPLVVIDVQRGGPSTGLPTQTEQSDLNLAVYGSHGDAPRIVLSCHSVADAFYTSIEAVNLARQYNVPVILLTDQSIGTRIEAFAMPDLEHICQDLTPDLATVPSYKPYDLSAPDGIVPRVPPGVRILDGVYPVASGLEHDEFGQPTAAPTFHMKMEEKRRKKLQALARTLPTPEVDGPASGEVLLVSWGSSRGPVWEALRRVRATGQPISGLHLKYINPLPPGLDAIFARFNLILVVELNDEGLYGYGQMAALLRARYCRADIQGINKTDGLTFRVQEIIDQMQARLAANKSI